MQRFRPAGTVRVLSILFLAASANAAGRLHITIVDDATDQVMPARVTITGPDGNVHVPGSPFARATIVKHTVPAGPGGKVRFVNVSAHALEIELPAGETVVGVSRGLEYRPLTRRVQIANDETHELALRMFRLFDLNAMGWYAADMSVRDTSGYLDFLKEVAGISFVPALPAIGKDQAADANLFFPLILEPATATAPAESATSLPRCDVEPGASKDDPAAVDAAFSCWHALLNAGKPAVLGAGSGFGISPRPLGAARCYVHLPDGFTPEAWFKGLDAGRWFVTSGPMLFVTADGLKPGDRRTLKSGAKPTLTLQVEARSIGDIESIQVIFNGRAVLARNTTQIGAGTSPQFVQLKLPVHLPGPGWLAVRCNERQVDGFRPVAHTAPIWFDAAR